MTAAVAANLGDAALNSSGTKTLTFTTAPFDRSNPSGATTPPDGLPAPVANQLGQRCDDAAGFRCDELNLSVTVTQAYLNSNPNAKLKITADWDDPGKGAQSLTDFDMYLLSGTETESSAEGGAGSVNPEVGTAVLSAGTANYKVRIVPYLTSPAGVEVTLTVALDDGASGGGGGAANVSAGGPTFRNYPVPTTGVGSTTNGASEPTMGIDLTQNRAYILMSYDAVGATFDADGNATWSNAGGGIAPISGDPSMAHNPSPINLGTGAGQCHAGQLDYPRQCDYSPRQWNIQLAVATSFMSFSDDNGGTWTQSSGPGQAHGADNQSVAAGPYPADAKPITALLEDYAVYYCSHGVVNAFCSRSDDGGLTFNPSRPIFPIDALCNNHGHVKVAVDGTVYVPMNNTCQGSEGVTVSIDAGETWHYIGVPATVQGRWDSSIAVGSDGKTIYYAYGEQTPQKTEQMVIKGTLSKAGGVPSITWYQPAANLSSAFGLNNTVFPAVVAGDSDRAAVAFHGTTKSGDSGQASAMGGAVWHLYVATTFDGGANWEVRKANDDPVQIGDICDQGTTCATTGNHRNLLDFMDADIDAEGRVMVAYADGCIGTCATGGAVTYADAGVIARQDTGKRMYAAYDPLVVNPLPGSPVLSGFRDDFGSYITWTKPSEGTAAITQYVIERAIGSGNFREIGTSSLLKFTDTSALDSTLTYNYRVTARNANGLGAASLSFAPAVLPESLCTGLTILTDGQGDVLSGIAPAQPAAPGAGAYDVRSLQVSQPGAGVTAGDYDIVLQLKMQDLTALPPGTEWPVDFNVGGVAIETTAATQTSAAVFRPHWTVLMHTTPPASPAAPAFELIRNPDSRAPYNTTIGQRLVTVLTGSSYSAATGIITFKIKGSQLATITGGQYPQGFKTPGTDKMLNFITRIVAGAITPDNMPQDLTAAGEYLTGSRYVCAANTAPIAVLNASAVTGEAPLSVTFDASNSSDDDTLTKGDTIRSYLFKFADENGGEEVSYTTAIQTRNYNAPGSYAYQLRVQDSRGKLSAPSSGFIVVTEQQLDRSPNPFSFAAVTGVAKGPGSSATSAETIIAGLGAGVSVPVTVSANGFYIKNGGTPSPDEGTAVNGDRFRLGHMAAATPSTDTTSSLTVGDYTASFTSTTAADPVGPTPIVASLTTTSPTTGEAPLTVVFDASGTTGGAAGLRYTFVYGNGQQSQAQTAATISYTYGGAGSFDAYVIVTDSSGQVDESSRITITPKVTVTVEPTDVTTAELSVSGGAGMAPLSVNFDASGSRAQSGKTIASYSFDFGDGSDIQTGTSATARHVYTVAGSYSATVTVTDNTGGTATDSETIVVTDNDITVAVLRIVGARSGPAPLTVNFDGSDSVAKTGEDIVSYSFDPDGSGPVGATTGSLATFSYTYTTPGSYEPTLTITDSEGATSQAKAAVTITPAATPAAAAPARKGGALGLLMLPLLLIAARRRSKAK